MIRLRHLCYLRLAAPVLLIAAAVSAFAAAPEHSPVQWTIKAAPTHPLKPGAKFDVVLHGQIEPGWHLYAMEEPEGGPIATQINLAADDPADIERVNQDKPRTVQDALFGQTLQVFQGAAGFTLHLVLEHAAPAGPHPLHILVRYQSCSDRVCLPPHTDTVELPLTVAR